MKKVFIIFLSIFILLSGVIKVNAKAVSFNYTVNIMKQDVSSIELSNELSSNDKHDDSSDSIAIYFYLYLFMSLIISIPLIPVFIRDNKKAIKNKKTNETDKKINLLSNKPENTTNKKVEKTSKQIDMNESKSKSSNIDESIFQYRLPSVGILNTNISIDSDAIKLLIKKNTKDIEDVCKFLILMGKS